MNDPFEPDPDLGSDLGSGPDPLVLDGPDGARVLGPATVDSDADGRADTVVGAVDDGLLLATDVDADGHVDVVSAIHGDGSTTTAVRGPDGVLVPPAAEHWDPGWDAPAPPAPWFDPGRGEWIRPA